MSSRPISFHLFAWLTLVITFFVFMTVSVAFSFMNIAASIASGLITIAGCTFVALKMTGRNWKSVTLLNRFSFQGIILGAVIALCNSVSLGDWLSLLSNQLMPEIFKELFNTSQLLANAVTNIPERITVFLSLVVFAPLAEEFLFRGVLFRAFLTRYSILLSVLLSGFIFSAYHLDPVGFLPRVEIGIILALLVHKTGSLWPAISAHAANNALASFFILTGTPEVQLSVPFQLVAFAILIGCLIILWKQATPQATEETLVGASSFFTAAPPWIAFLLASAAVILAVDSKGASLTQIDVTVPLIGKGSEEEANQLNSLRAKARNGEIEIEEYRTLRTQLSKERFQVLMKRFLPKVPQKKE
jgi:uncharacterized protein